MENLTKKYGKLISVILAVLVIGFSVAQIWSASKTWASFQTNLLPMVIMNLIACVCLVIGLISENEKMVKGNLCVFFAITAIGAILTIFNSPVNMPKDNFFTAVNFVKNGWAFSLHHLFAIFAGFALIIALFLNVLSKYFQTEILSKVIGYLLCLVCLFAIFNFVLTFIANGMNLYLSVSAQRFDVYHITEDLTLLFSASLINFVRQINK
mgnify:CR=1 FL=1